MLRHIMSATLTLLLIFSHFHYAKMPCHYADDDMLMPLLLMRHYADDMPCCYKELPLSAIYLLMLIAIIIDYADER